MFPLVALSMLDNVVETIVAVDLVGVYGAVGDVGAISIRHGLGLVVSGKKSLAKLFLQLISRCKKRKEKYSLQLVSFQLPPARLNVCSQGLLVKTLSVCVAGQASSSSTQTTQWLVSSLNWICCP